jgi:glycosyltransferase involved in cell wall biosynthesis
MRILVIPSERYVPKDSPLEGIFQQCQAKALKKAGYHVGIISPQWRPIRSFIKGLSGGSIESRVENDQQIPIFHNNSWPWIPPVLWGRVWLWFRVGEVLFKKYIKEYGKPDIIHAHNARFAGVLAAYIKERWNIPFVLTEHSSAYVRGLAHKWERGYIQKAFRLANKRIVVSPSLGHTLEGILGKVVIPWEWIPNILDSLFERSSLFRETQDPGGQAFRFLNVGALIRIKGQADLLHAFANKFKGEKDVELRIAGEGPLRKELQGLVHELNIAERVVFLGQLDREQVFTEMTDCDAYVHPSHYESFGVTLIEALSCGKPVIATASGGPECIVKEGNGVLVPRQDIERLGEAMAQMFRKNEKYDAAWIRKDCIERFGSQTIVKELSSVYRQVCESGERIM